MASVSGASRPQATLAGWELALAGVVAFLFTSPAMLLLGAPDETGWPDTPLLRLFWPPVYLGVLVLVGRRASRLGRYAFPLAACIAIVGWASVSTLWSIDSDVTSRRALGLGFTTLFGVYLGSVLSGRRMVEVLAGVFLVAGALSLAMGICAPTLGVQHGADVEGDWRGLWTHKNALASWMVVGVLASVCAARLATPRRALWLFTTGVCLALLVLSRGKTGLVALALVAAVSIALAVLQRGPVERVLMTWFAVVGGALALGVVVVAPEIVLTALGKDATLTGRTDIWAAVLRRVAERPWLGYGYSAFWQRGSVPATIVADEAHWIVPSAHNGWLDLLLQVGRVGVALFACALALALAAAAWRGSRLGDRFFSLLYILFFCLLAMSESVLEQQNTLLWALFVAALTRALGPATSGRIEPAGEPPRPVFSGFANAPATFASP